jgi:hypothetical protein
MREAANLERFLSGRERASGPTGIATVVGETTDGSGDYNITLDDTGFTVRASKGQPTLSLSAGQRVLFSRADASGRFRNTGYTILGFPPSVAKGSSALARSNLSTSKTGAVVTMINPASLSIAPNTNQAVQIRGVGLDSVTLSYGSSDLTNNVAPIITPTLITLSIHAAALAVLGGFDLAVGSQIFKRYFTISN